MSALAIAAAIGLAIALGGGSKSSGVSGGGWSGGGSGGALEDEDEDHWELDPEEDDEPPLNINCDGVGPDGGETDGAVYTEIVTGGANPNASLPMVIALHGLGQDKEYMANKLAGLDFPARIIIPDGLYDRAEGYPGRRWWRGYNPAGLQAHMTEKIPEAVELLAPFVARIQNCRPTIGRPLVVGHSQGGYVALEFALYPQLVSGVVSSAAWRPVALWNEEPVTPVIAVHGKNDTGVDYDRSLDYYEEMIDRGLDFEHRPTSGSHSLGTTNLNAFKQAIIDSLTRSGFAGAHRSTRVRYGRRFR
jgi:predicted esterase